MYSNQGMNNSTIDNTIINKTTIIIVVLLSFLNSTAQTYNNWLLPGGSILNFNSLPTQISCNVDFEDATRTIALSDDKGVAQLFGYLKKSETDETKYEYTIINTKDEIQARVNNLRYTYIRNVIGCRLNNGGYCIAFVSMYIRSSKYIGDLYIFCFDKDGVLTQKYKTEDSYYTSFMTFLTNDNYLSLVVCNYNGTLDEYIIKEEEILKGYIFQIDLPQFRKYSPVQFDIELTINGNKIVASCDGEVMILDYDKETDNLTLSDCFSSDQFKTMAFSPNDKYLMTIYNNKLIKYPLSEDLTFDQTNCEVMVDFSKNPKYNINSDETKWDMQLGPDGCLYICNDHNDYILSISNIEDDNLIISEFNNDCLRKKNASHSKFPQITRRQRTITIAKITICASHEKKYSVESPDPSLVYHWQIIGGTLSNTTGSEVTVTWDDSEGLGTLTVYAEDPSSGCKSEITEYKVQRRKSPSATFDNAQVCYGEPLKINLAGTAPYQIFYTFNGETKTITTSDNEYLMDNITGRYQITKVTDQFCETEPTQNNTAEILPKLNKLTITTNDD